MSIQREPDRKIVEWLHDEARSGAPDRLFATTRTRLASTRQRRSWWPVWRIPTMKAPLTIVLTAALAVVVAVGAMTLLPRSTPQNAATVPGASPLATTPVASPSAPSTRSPSPASPATSQLPELRPGSVLSVGDYQVSEPFAVPFSIKFTGPWTADTLSTGSAVIHKVDRDASGAESWPVWLRVDLVDNVYPNPCFPDQGLMDPPVARTVDGIVDALTHLPKSTDPGGPIEVGGFDTTPVADVVIDGHRGKRFELLSSVPTGQNRCTNDPWLPLWTAEGESEPYSTLGFATNRVWVLDVDGSPVLIAAETFENTPAAYVDEIGPTVESIRFGP